MTDQSPRDAMFTARETITELTEEAIQTMMNAQFLITASALNSAVARGYSDDDIDYIPAALDLANVLMCADYDSPLFNIEQLRRHIAFIPTDYVANEILAMLFDSYEHYESYDLPMNESPPADYDCVNPHTWKLAD